MDKPSLSGESYRKLESQVSTIAARAQELHAGCSDVRKRLCEGLRQTFEATPRLRWGDVEANCGRNRMHTPVEPAVSGSMKRY